MTDIQTLQNGLLADIAAADTPDAVEAIRVRALGKSGKALYQSHRAEQHDRDGSRRCRK